MAGLIPQTFIDDLLDRVDIVDVVNSRVQLKKAGKNYKACCPFHEEKSPSFTVAQDKQFYYCFGCGAGGNALGFVMEFDRLDFLPAVEMLAKNAGMEIPREAAPDQRVTKKKDSLYSILTKSDKFFRQQLRTHQGAKVAVDYLKGRGLSGKIAAQFGVGYAPPGWDNLLKVAGGDDQKNKLLDESGMIIVKPEEKKQYDRFRHRIMFPIRDQRGRTIGFGGRVLDDSTPKYLNSPETPVFHKGRELYGLYEARQALKEIPCLIMVEGYMDVIALAQYGIANAVATLGTALTENHLQKLFRYTSEIVFCFDGDSAGRRAAARSLEIALPEMRDGVSAKFLFLPDGEDPDSMVRQLGTEAFLEQVEKSQPLSEFLFEQLSDGIDSSTADGKARLSKTCAPQINRIPQGVFRQLMLEELSRRTGVSADNLRDYVATHVTPQQRAAIANDPNHETGSQTQSTDQHNHASSNDYHYPEQDSSLEADDYADMRPTRASKIRLSPIKFITALLLNHPALAEAAEDIGFLKQSTDQDTQLFLRVLDVAKKNPHYKPSHIFAYWLGTHGNQAETKILQSLAASELYHPPVGTGRDDHQEFSDALAHVIQSAFDALPIQEKALHLLEQKTLSEREIKQLHRIRLQLANDQQSSDLKNKIKQRLVV
ncbi:MAG: DNA primase [Porticoccaceae bacterium]|nr:DNA primase [Porticoccaceae bacterium]|tara:strand:- start:1965 stop:3929 length:1965 start_codon:yes stop_codon:yes gene_type:complete